MFDNLFWSISWEQAVGARGKTTQWRPARRCTPVSTCAQKIYFFTSVNKKKKHHRGFEWTKLMHILLHLDQPIRKAFHPCRQNFTIPHQPHILHMKHILMIWICQPRILHVKHILIEHCTDARTTENWREKKLIFVYLLLYTDGMAALAGKRSELKYRQSRLSCRGSLSAGADSLPWPCTLRFTGTFFTVVLLYSTACVYFCSPRWFTQIFPH